ncbi:MAG: prephenate dehydratase [Candidatus Levyibacteriota bacterium]|nr:MAG: prephenate dehydratase [Candidatus Levybacteria bacterium]
MKNNQPLIGIIGGTGKMGQWFTQFFQDHELLVLTASRKTALSIESLAKKANIIIVSVPISETQKTLKKIIPHISKDKLLTDLTSFKVMPMETMKEAESGTLGMHPLFGPSATLDQKLKIVFCKQKNNSHVTFLEDLFTKSGIEIIEISAEEHDYQMAYIQAFTNAINLLYAKIIFEHKNVLENKLHTPIFTLQSLIMGRVLNQDIKLTSDLQLYNPYFLPVLEAFVTQAKKLETIIEKEDEKAFVEMFSEEQALTKNFASFSTLQTNKLLLQVNNVTVTIPSKISEIDLSKNADVAYLGPEGTFSHLAVLTAMPHNTKVSYETIYDIFNAVQNGDIKLGIIPAENSIEGTVKETLDYLIDFSLMVIGSFELPIHQQFLSKEKNLTNIHTVASHPQALAQCRNWIKKHVPNAKTISTSSTTNALQNPQKGYAYIASKLAAKQYHMSILVKDIEDNPNNRTKFYIVARKKIKIDGISNNKTLIFATVHNRVGILRDILNVFATHQINLTKLESRPSGGKHVWDYHFFIEFEKNQKNVSLSQLFSELKPYCPIIRTLGKT